MRTEEEIRFECMRLAQHAESDAPPEKIAERAREYAAFVTAGCPSFGSLLPAPADGDGVFTAAQEARIREIVREEIAEPSRQAAEISAAFAIITDRVSSAINAGALPGYSRSATEGRRGAE